MVTDPVVVTLKSTRLDVNVLREVLDVHNFVNVKTAQINTGKEL